jgi:hypothetical protein
MSWLFILRGDGTRTKGAQQGSSKKKSSWSKYKESISKRRGKEWCGGQLVVSIGHLAWLQVFL